MSNQRDKSKTLYRSVLSACALVMVGVSPSAASDNPPAEGFNEAGSDAKAITIADQVMEAMGGRAAWDDTRYLTWNFFGRRRHVWDKFTGDIRVEGVRRDDEKSYLILMNIHTKKGKAWLEGQEIIDPTELSEFLDLGESAWINDSYWVFMPYKLKDSGVTLEYAGGDEMLDGRASQGLQLTVEEVG